MKIHILGICGTFMGGIALLARQAGHEVSGSDENVYPPMSTQLEQQGICLCRGYKAEHIADDVDQVVIGNALSRGNAAVEYVLNKNIPYISGPQWLAENIFTRLASAPRWVLAVAGTHGKTSTSSMLAWILDYAGLTPGFLIGGVPANFGLSARCGEAPFFVVEADEYDTAFFDKRSKFVHYHPRTAILNNLEFDHADIFENLDAIKKQFHHLVRTVPGEGLLVVNGEDKNLASVISRGCWTGQAFFIAKHGQLVQQQNEQVPQTLWSIGSCSPDGSRFEIVLNNRPAGEVNWSIHGRFNRLNALAAIIAARHAGVPVAQACAALAEFRGIKRRLEVRGVIAGITVYDDFAHHPTAIAETLSAMEEVQGAGKIFVILEPRSNTMRMGVHKTSLAAAFNGADEVLLFQPASVNWDLNEIAKSAAMPVSVYDSTETIIQQICCSAKPGDHVLIMSNGAFEGIHQRLLDALKLLYAEKVIA